MPVDTTWVDGTKVLRTQICLKSRWAITMNKSQGHTLKKAVTPSGDKEECIGLRFVCLSRANIIDDIAVQPVPYDRLSGLDFFPQL